MEARRPTAPWPHVRDATLVEMFVSGRTVYEMAREFDSPRSTIQDQLRRLGLCASHRKLERKADTIIATDKDRPRQLVSDRAIEALHQHHGTFDQHRQGWARP